MNSAAYTRIRFSLILLFTISLCAVLSPFFLLSFFTHPQVDDFCFAVSFRYSDFSKFFVVVVLVVVIVLVVVLGKSSQFTVLFGPKSLLY